MRKDNELSQLLKGNVELILLAALEGGPMHGYGLTALVSEMSGGKFVLGEATVYPQLRKLSGAGYIVGKWESLPGGVPRKAYAITDAGHAELARLREAWLRFSSAMEGFMGKPAEVGAG